MIFVKVLLIIKFYLNMCNYCWLGKNFIKSCVSIKWYEGMSKIKII